MILLNILNVKSDGRRSRIFNGSTMLRKRITDTLNLIHYSKRWYIHGGCRPSFCHSSRYHLHISFFCIGSPRLTRTFCIHVFCSDRRWLCFHSHIVFKFILDRRRSNLLSILYLIVCHLFLVVKKRTCMCHQWIRLT